MSIRIKLAALYAVALALTLLVAGAVTWWEVGNRLRAGLDATLQARADGVVTAIENDGQVGLQEGDATPAAIFVAIFDASGTRLDATANTPKGLRPASGALQLGGQEYQLHLATAPDGSSVVTGASTAPLDASRNDLAWAVLAGVAPAAGLSLLAGLLIARRALRPVDRMTAEAAAIGSHDLEWRVQEPGSGDELGRLARTLNAMLERISGSVAQQRAFVAEASHELRTPLAALRAELELADRPDATAEELRAAVRAAQSDATRLADVADALLRRAMLASDETETLRTHTAIADVVQASVRRITLPARQRGVRVLTSVSRASVEIDRLRMEQAIANLLQNAVAHGPEGSTVELNSRTVGMAGRHAWLVEVLDRGPGILARTADQLFPAAGRESRNGRHDASAEARDAAEGAVRRTRRGFGLASVRAAVEAHGGRYGAENRPDGGARFWFSVPI
ncbi:MAG: two-component system, OmpR family, sensor kinase [Chloroflexota bacterium]|nr:two-component system, OmpR family, sensor kinase [Chloroflexota bacterium]